MRIGTVNKCVLYTIIKVKNKKMTRFMVTFVTNKYQNYGY